MPADTMAGEGCMMGADTVLAKWDKDFKSIKSWWASTGGYVCADSSTAPALLAPGMRVFYATEMDGPLDEDGWPGPKVPNTSDKSDTGTVTEAWVDANGRRSFVITWDRWQDGSDEPDLDEAQADGRLVTVDGWALPLTDAASGVAP